MALGMISAGVGIAQSIGGLFGGGGPRQPRMNRAQRQHMQQHQQQQQMMRMMMQMMMQMMQMMQRGMMGRRCGQHPGGQCCQQGMNGANQFGNMGFPQNPMGNMFGQQQGPVININLGGGGQFGNMGNFGVPPMGGAHFAMGLNMYA